MIDPTSEEECCSIASILMSVMPNGKVTSVVKLGYGSLLPSTLIKMMQVITIPIYVDYHTLWLSKADYVEFVFESKSLDFVGWKGYQSQAKRGSYERTGRGN